MHLDCVLSELLSPSCHIKPSVNDNRCITELYLQPSHATRSGLYSRPPREAGEFQAEPVPADLNFELYLNIRSYTCVL